MIKGIGSNRHWKSYDIIIHVVFNRCRNRQSRSERNDFGGLDHLVLTNLEIFGINYLFFLIIFILLLSFSGMATSINLEHILQGQLLALSKHDLLVESPDKFVPRTKVNVGYIVSAVIINEAGKILLVQEAKRSCRGLWSVLCYIKC